MCDRKAMLSLSLTGQSSELRFSMDWLRFYAFLQMMAKIKASDKFLASCICAVLRGWSGEGEREQVPMSFSSDDAVPRHLTLACGLRRDVDFKALLINVKRKRIRKGRGVKPKVDNITKEEEIRIR